MFRTVRGFLLVAPPAFFVGFLAFLLSRSHAVESYVTYPFLADAIGNGLSKRPVARFGLTSLLFFLIPYLVTALLLFLAEIGTAAAAPLWKGRKGSRLAEPPPESRIGFVAATLLVAAILGFSLHRVAHGGELAGGVNVAPFFVAAVPFAATVAGLLVAGLVAVPRALHERFIA